VDAQWCGTVCADEPNTDDCRSSCKCAGTKEDGGAQEKQEIAPPEEEELASANAPREQEQAEKEQAGCKSIVANLGDEWCETTCSNAPDDENCKAVCKCPPPPGQSKRPLKDPEPPQPRIIGGWTDCGRNSGITDRRFELRSRIPQLTLSWTAWAIMATALTTSAACTAGPLM
jgi:hypothetical protein